MENSSAASASSEAGSSRSQEIEELERFIDSYVLEYQVQGLLADKTEGDGESEKTQSHISQVSAAPGSWGGGQGPGQVQGLGKLKGGVRGPYIQTASGCLALDCQGAGGPTHRAWDPCSKSLSDPLTHLCSVLPHWANLQFLEHRFTEHPPCAVPYPRLPCALEEAWGLSLIQNAHSEKAVTRASFL